MSEESTRKKNETERIVNPEVAEDDYQNSSQLNTLFGLI